MKEKSRVPSLNVVPDFRAQISQDLLKRREKTHNIRTSYLVSTWKRRFPLRRDVGDRSRCGKCADCESSWLPEYRQRSNIVDKDGNTGTVAVVPSLKRLSTRRALGWGRVGRPVTTYCEGLSLWKARRDFLPLTPENPPRVSSRESRFLCFRRHPQSSLRWKTSRLFCERERICAYRKVGCRVCRNPKAYRAECFRELGALSRSRNVEEQTAPRIVALFR